MSFKIIKGQDPAIKILKANIAQLRLSGGYLFSGPEGIGKRLTAQALAKAMNCLKDNLDACDICISCLKIQNKRHPDVHIIENGESEIKIESIRQLKQEINLKAYEARYKVFIIDNAHNLTIEAGNALLKILEEPPQDSLIVLVSDKPSLLLKTVVSRCKIIKFSPLRRIKLEEILKKDYGLNNNIAHFLAFFSEGRIGRALRLKESDIFKEKNSIIDNFVFARRPNLDNLSIQNREMAKNHLNMLATWFRDIYIIKAGLNHLETIHLDRRQELLKETLRFSFSDLDGIFEAISETILCLQQNMNIKLLLYNLMIPLCARN